MPPTLKDVAALSGVHPSTVSRVLHKKEDVPVSAETRHRILDAIKQLNYKPDYTARALRLKKSHTVGLIVPDISNSFFSKISQSIGSHGYTAGYTLVVCETYEDQSKEIRFVHDLISRGVDGLIIVPVQNSESHIRDLMEKSNIPFVLVDRCFEDLETNTVVSDNEMATFQAVSYLYKLGHHRIGFISGRRNLYTILKRLEGYRRAVYELGLDDSEELISGDGFTLDKGYEATSELLSLLEPPSAILVSGNMISVGAIKAITEKGLSIPEDISMVSFTDTEYSPYLITPLTTISHPVKEIGEKAFKLLLKHMESKYALPSSKIIVETELIVRKSTAKYAQSLTKLGAE